MGELLQLCECGCGKLVKHEGDKFLHGHNMRGKKRVFSEESCLRMRVSHLGISLPESTKLAMSKASIGKHKSPEHCKNIRLGLAGYGNGRKLPNEQKIAISCGIQGIEIEDFDGFISDMPYCPKFNDKLKQKVRDKYNECDYFSGLHYTVCNIMNNGKVHKLDIHHVDYNKTQGCEGHKWRLIPLSRRNHTKTSANRSFWERLICYALEYDETYYNIRQINIMEMIRNASRERANECGNIFGI